MVRLLGIIFLIALTLIGCDEGLNLQDPANSYFIDSESSGSHLSESFQIISEDVISESSTDYVVEKGSIITSIGIIIDSDFISELWVLTENYSEDSWALYKNTHPDVLFGIDFNNAQRINQFVENYRNGIKDSFMVFNGEGWGDAADYLILYDYNGKGKEYTYSWVVINPPEIVEEYGIYSGKETILNHIEESELTNIFGAYDNGNNNGQIIFPKYGWRPIKIAETNGEVGVEEAQEKLQPFVKERIEKYHQGDIWLVHDTYVDNRDYYDFNIYFQYPEVLGADYAAVFRGSVK